MNDKTITALAREYAEEISPVRQLDGHPVSKMIADIMRKALSEVTAEQIKNFEGFIRFLFRRYYMVEKEAVRKEYGRALETNQKGIEASSHVLCAIGCAQRALLESLFPEIAKEVEG